MQNGADDVDLAWHVTNFSVNSNLASFLSFSSKTSVRRHFLKPLNFSFHPKFPAYFVLILGQYRQKWNPGDKLFWLGLEQFCTEL